MNLICPVRRKFSYGTDYGTLTCKKKNRRIVNFTLKFYDYLPMFSYHFRNWLKVAKSLCSFEEAKEFCLDMIDDEISSLESELSGEDQRIGFCHNDLQYGNIMMDEETRQITIIVSFLLHHARCNANDIDIYLTICFLHFFQDYEYASFNPVAYDIANHFCEMAADYHTETPHILDYSKYPG